MYDYEVRKKDCKLELFEVFKNGECLGEILYAIFDSDHTGFYFLSQELDNLPCEERLYLEHVKIASY